jgi:Cu(I)/Ag(I) efflux system membrane fusion protein/cobalt-zinc-cadmium efflux system membrane fusion protein
MTTIRSPRLVLVAFVAGLAVLAGGAYAFRGDLARLPLVGGLFGGHGAPAADLYVCPMHPEVQSPAPARCPQCGMDLVKQSELAGASHDHDHPEPPPPDARAPVQLDLRRQQLIGVRLAAAETATLDRSVRAVGTVAFDETRLADVNVQVDGFVRTLHVNASGVFVAKGQPLFALYSPELLATEQEYLLALRAREQVRASANGADEAAGYADRLAGAARQRLALWRLPASEIEELERTRQPRDTVTFTSPASGYVIEKNVVSGQRVMAGERLYRLADLSTVWVEADVYERDLAGVKRGARATVTVDAWPGESFDARVVLVAPALDAATRTARVRFALANPGAKLRPGMFANVELAAASVRGLTVPADAVVDSGTRRFVFVSQGEGFFEPRPVEIGARGNGLIEITKGLAEGEQVASGATFFIDSESQLRAAMEGFEALPDLAAPAEGGEKLQIDFRTDPDPPRNGDSGFEVAVRTAAGAPVEDAEVAVRLYMPPMPSMNMPAMRTDVALLHAGGGVYRGRGNISMSGKWDVSVTVVRDGARIGTRMLGIVAK